MDGVDTLLGCWVVLFANSQCRSTIFRMTFHIIRQWRNTNILRVWKFFNSLRGNQWFKNGSVIVHNIFVHFMLSLSAAQACMIQERCWFSQIEFFTEYFPHRINVLCCFPAIMMTFTYTKENNHFSRCTKRHSQFGIFSQPSVNRIFFSNGLTNDNPAKGWPYMSRSEGTTGSSTVDHDFGHLCGGRRIQISGHSDLKVQ